jgi:hypothetical protein
MSSPSRKGINQLRLPVISGQLKKRRWHAIMLTLCLVAMFILLSAFLSTLSLINSLSMRDGQGNVLKGNVLQASWVFWNSHGKLISPNQYFPHGNMTFEIIPPQL